MYSIKTEYDAPRGIPTTTPVGVMNWQARLGERRRRDVVLLDTARGSPFLIGVHLNAGSGINRLQHQNMEHPAIDHPSGMYGSRFGSRNPASGAVFMLAMLRRAPPAGVCSAHLNASGVDNRPFCANFEHPAMTHAPDMYGIRVGRPEQVSGTHRTT